MRGNLFLLKRTKMSRLKPPRQISTVTYIILKKVSMLNPQTLLFSANTFNTVNLLNKKILHGGNEFTVLKI